MRFFDRLATENPALARAEVALWPRHDEFFFDKLRIYVLMKSGLLTAHECAEGILALCDDGLWNRYHRRELLYTLRARWDEFSDEDRRCIEARLLQGPDQWDQEDPDEYARRKAIASATLLGWLKLQGCELSSEAEQQPPSCERPTIAGGQAGMPLPMIVWRPAGAGLVLTGTARRLSMRLWLR